MYILCSDSIFKEGIYFFLNELSWDTVIFCMRIRTRRISCNAVSRYQTGMSLVYVFSFFNLATSICSMNSLFTDRTHVCMCAMSIRNRRFVASKLIRNRSLNRIQLFLQCRFQCIGLHATYVYCMFARYADLRSFCYFTKL
jgi:hypothetical protein